MKISYDNKTDYMAIRFESVAESRVADYGKGIDIVLSEVDDSIIGYNLFDARESIIQFKEVLSIQKLAMLITIYRIRAGLTQEQLHIKTNVSLPTIKLIEGGERETGIEDLFKIKRVLSEIDLNWLSISKAA